MDFKDPNFFRLNYLCLNKLGPLSNQSVIIEKNISKPNKIQRVRSGTASFSKNISTVKYTKIDNSKSLLKDKNDKNPKNVLTRARSNNRKVFSNIYQSYCTENNRVNTGLDFPILLSPTTPENREIRQKNYNFNLYNEIICKTNNHQMKEIILIKI